MAEIRKTYRRTGSRDAVLARLAKDPIGRREFIKRFGVAGMFALAGPAVLAACGDGSTSTTVGLSGTTLSASMELFVDNWILYIDTTEDSPDGTSTIDAFEEESGISVSYTEGVNSNEEWFGKYQAQLAAGQPTGFDIVVLTDYMAARMLRLEYAEKIDKANVPNMANLVDVKKR